MNAGHGQAADLQVFEGGQAGRLAQRRVHVEPPPEGVARHLEARLHRRLSRTQRDARRAPAQLAGRVVEHEIDVVLRQRRWCAASPSRALRGSCFARMRFALSISSTEISALRATSGASWRHIQTATSAATGSAITRRTKSFSSFMAAIFSATGMCRPVSHHDLTARANLRADGFPRRSLDPKTSTFPTGAPTSGSCRSPTCCAASASASRGRFCR